MDSRLYVYHPFETPEHLQQHVEKIEPYGLSIDTLMMFVGYDIVTHDIDSPYRDDSQFCDNIAMCLDHCVDLEEYKDFPIDYDGAIHSAYLIKEALLEHLYPFVASVATTERDFGSKVQYIDFENHPNKRLDMMVRSEISSFESGI